MGNKFGTPLTKCVNRTFLLLNITFLNKERLVNNPNCRNKKRIYMYYCFYIFIRKLPVALPAEIKFANVPNRSLYPLLGFGVSMPLKLNFGSFFVLLEAYSTGNIFS